MHLDTDPKKLLRQKMRALRQSLGADERAAAARRLCRNALKQRALREAERIAVYLAFDGELDPAPLVSALWKQGKQLFLPVLSRLAPGRMRFVQYTPSSKLRPNRYGILEPVLKPSVRGSALDLVLLPLTAFDHHGGRLGMGGGFYDRTFPVRHAARSKPRLLGVAYRFQCVTHLPLELHDRRIDGVLTD